MKTFNFKYCRKRQFGAVAANAYHCGGHHGDMSCYRLSRVPFDDLCKRGFIPINQMLNYKRFYDILLYDNIKISTTKKDNFLFPVQNKFNF